ncbi:bifunctional glycosyltransferase/CDP-glycerol:glycerophosphate glycerophosphotransferase [Streptomyces palmae]|uniref:Glycosyltransferase n=1 Tax=Streptomyces palmae TaxID=1701085 RepID=A0A4Z0GUU3_9ACTN|nr:bifunctional glycosyltransferase/CDP-glycerol:glycerophosphate glycerophosphotransferase [Streptomyces palmae]TGB00954.1 glycosyltransferase [Streptomyces palmae]
MPRFSVIVPVHKVQAYLHDCLRSVLTQDFTDFELIAVDDRSPDACGAILDEAAAQDDRVRALHLAENVGLGRARNVGMRHAEGDYLLFLDSDDTLAPGSLRAIADRLAATDDPAVLVYDYARLFWTGATARNQRSELLATPPGEPEVFRLVDRPDLLNLLMVVWNKVYRRDFVEREGFTFPPGLYEDTPWTYPVLMTAETVATLDRVCVLYRQRRRGSILNTTSWDHFDVFDQYDRVFAFVDSRPALGRWRPLLFRRMLDHLAAIYAAPGRLPPGSRAEFARRTGAHHRRHHTVAAGPPTGFRPRVRSMLLRLGACRAFNLVHAVRRGRRRIATLAQAVRRTLRGAALHGYYLLQRCLPVDQRLAVFAAYWHRGYACNPAALEEAVRRLAPHIRTAWITTPRYAHTLPAGVQRLQPGSAAYWAALARARYLVNNVNFTDRLRKRPEQVHLQTHHGTPLKHMGLDLQDHPAAARGMDFERLLRRVDRWDHSLSANRHSTLTWERVYPSTYTTLEYGYPRNDIFQRATAEDVLRIRDALGIEPGITALLYAPTHRDYQRVFTPRLDLARLAHALGPGFVLLVRAHYFHPDGLRGPYDDGRIIDVSAHPRVEELCLASDALLTDYSSIMFDYANLDRPIVLHADDWEPYRAARGVYLDITAAPPGPVTRTEDELIELFSGDAWRDAESARLRAAFRARFCPYDDGRAAERVVRRVFLGEPEETLPRVVPPSERRPAPAPDECLAQATATAASLL